MSERQITRNIATYPGETTPLHHWTATVNGETVADLWVDITTGEIMNVETAKNHQGHGHASALYRQAATEIAIFHAPEAHRTYEGNRFAASVGGPALPCLHGCAMCAADTDDED
jgi:hypothetical protein